jgi:hypothetical protein
MSTSKRKRKGDGTADAIGWILGTVIVLLATLDLLVWATLHTRPNPFSKAVADYGQVASKPVRTAAH